MNDIEQFIITPLAFLIKEIKELFTLPLPIRIPVLMYVGYTSWLIIKRIIQLIRNAVHGQYFICRKFKNGTNIKRYQNTIGDNGEYLVAKQLSIIPNINASLLNDIVVPYKRTYAQIDHVLITEKGIFVVETKNYHQGEIVGNRMEQSWTHKYGDTSNEFYNPIIQNEHHIIGLKTALKPLAIPDNIFINLVCFSGDSVISVPNSHELVLLKNLQARIYEYTKTVLTTAQITEITDYLNNIAITDRKVIDRYIASVKRKENAVKQQKRKML